MSISSVFQNVTSLRNATVPNVVVQGTDVGYDVKMVTPFGDRAVLIERVAAIAGLTLVGLALAGIYAGRVYHLQGLGSGHLVAGAVLLTGGIAYVWISARGMRHQAQFDLEKREMKYVVHNRLDGCRTLRLVSFDQINAAFIKRPSEPGKPALLYVRIGEGEDLIEVARGSEEDLEALHTRLSHDLPHAA